MIYQQTQEDIDAQEEANPTEAISVYDFLNKRAAKKGGELTAQEYNDAVETYTQNYRNLAVRNYLGDKYTKEQQSYAEQNWDNAAAAIKRKTVDTTTDKALNIGKSFLSGALGSVSDIVKVADTNVVTDFLDDTSKDLVNSKTADSKIIANRNQAARNKASEQGGFFNIVKTAIEKTTLEDVASGAGSIAPTALAALATGGTSAAAQVAARVLPSVIGAAQGVGGLKSGINAKVYQDAINAGKTEAEAKQMANSADDYSEIPFYQTAGAGILGAASGVFGAEANLANKALLKTGTSNVLKRVAVSGLEEGAEEAAQTAQSSIAANQASIAKGLSDKGLFSGVLMDVAQATILGGAVGGGFGIKKNNDIHLGDVQNTIDAQTDLDKKTKMEVQNIVKQKGVKELIDDTTIEQGSDSNLKLARELAMTVDDAYDNRFTKAQEKKTEEKKPTTLDELIAKNDIPNSNQQVTEPVSTEQKVNETVIDTTEVNNNEPVNNNVGVTDAAVNTESNNDKEATVDNTVQDNVNEKKGLFTDSILDNLGNEINQKLEENYNKNKTYGNIAKFNPRETGNKPRTEAINRAIDEIKSEGYEVNNDTAQVWADEHWNSYLDYLDKTNQKSSANKDKFIEGTVDNILATEQLNFKKAYSKDDLSYTRANKRLDYLNSNESGWQLLSRKDLGDRGRFTESQYLNKKSKKLEKNKIIDSKIVNKTTITLPKNINLGTEPNFNTNLGDRGTLTEYQYLNKKEKNTPKTPPLSLVGKYVSYQGINGLLRQDKNGIYVIGQDSNVYVDSGLSGATAEELGLRLFTVKLNTPRAKQNKEKQKTNNIVEKKVYVKPVNENAKKSFDEMQKQQKLLSAEAIEINLFNDAVDLLVLEYGDKTAGFILDKIEERLGNNASRLSIIKELEYAINTKNTPFRNIQIATSNTQSNTNNAEKRTTEADTREQSTAKREEVETKPALQIQSRVLQNRNRQSPQSIAQMTAIAAKPDFMRAGISNTMQDGAPVVFSDADELPSGTITGDNDTAVDGKGNRYSVQYAVMEGNQILTSNKADGTPIAEYDNGTPNTVRPVAGNGRAAGIKQGYTQGTAGQYRSELEAKAQRIGIDPAAIKGMKYPVLVRVMPKEQVKDDIGDLSNISQTAALSPVEQAKTDAARIDLDRIEFDGNGVTTDSVTKWVSSLPQTEASSLTSDDKVSKQAISRLANAVFYKAYGSDELVKLYGESTDPEIVRVINAVGSAAPFMIQLEGTGDYDIRGAVVEATQMAVNAKRKGEKLSDYLKTVSFTESGEGVAIALFFAENYSSGKAIKEGLINLAQTAINASDLAKTNETQNSFFEPATPATRQQIFKGLENAKQTNDTTKRDEQRTGDVDNGSTKQKADDPVPKNATKKNEQKPVKVAKPVKEEPILTQQTADEARQSIADKEAATKAKAKEDARIEAERKAEQDAKEVKQAVATSADNFVLGGIAEDELSGQASILNSLPITDVKSSGEEKQTTKFLAVGAMPNSAENITVKNGVIYLGKYLALDFESGDDVKVPANASNEQIKKALRDAGAINKKDKFFELSKPAVVRYSLPRTDVKKQKSTVSNLRKAIEGIFGNPSDTDTKLNKVFLHETFSDLPSGLQARLTDDGQNNNVFYSNSEKLKKITPIEKAVTPLSDTKTVTVDDKEYSVFNNLGKPIHPTVEGVRNFVRWFGDSKVTDNGKPMSEGGKPLVMYHGTNYNEGGNAFKSFDPYSSNFGLFGQGSYFTDDPDVASSYTTKGKGKTPSVYPVYLKIDSPMDMDAIANKEDWINSIKTTDFNDFKGVTNEDYFKYTRDYENEYNDVSSYEIQDAIFGRFKTDGVTHIGGGRFKNSETKHKVFIIKDDTQAKSATGNNGSFTKNEGNNDIWDARYLSFSKNESTAQAFYDPSTKEIHLIADRIEQGSESAVFLHEVWHKQGLNLLGKENLKGLSDAVKEWKNQPATTVERQVYDAANRRAGLISEFGKDANLYDAEFLNYAIEEAKIMGVTPDIKAKKGSIANWFAQVFDAFNRALNKLINGMRIKNNNIDFNVQDLMAMAYGAAGLEYNNILGDLNETGQKDRRRIHTRRGKITPFENAPTIRGITGPIEGIVTAAERYAAKNGINLKRQAEYATIDEQRSKRIAQAYKDMPHAPNSTLVKESYEEMIKQTKAQYKSLVDAGYKFWLFDDIDSKYASSPWNAIFDLRENKSMGVFSTEVGFGSNANQLPKDSNPMLQDTGIKWPYGSLNGVEKRVLVNDLFRAVHDAYGHGLEGAGFRAQGEENAWQAHVRLFTGKAIGAITTETRGQNSWVNFGEHGSYNAIAKAEDTIFAEQKIGLMPEWTWAEGRVGDVEYEGKKTGAQSDGVIANSQAPFDGKETAKTPLGDTKTVTVDGKEYSVFNSLGKPIHPTVEGVRNFVRWFGDSKVTDNGKAMSEGGEPLLVYHGTDNGGFTIFGNSGYGRTQSEKGFWFSERSRASEYSGTSKEIKIVPKLQSWDDVRIQTKSMGLDFSAASEDEYEAGNYFVGELLTNSLDEARDILQTAYEQRSPAGLYQVYLSIKNPKIIDAQGKRGIDVDINVSALKKKGFDGVIIKNVDDPGRYGEYGNVADNYVAFYPNQIKSATGNNGDFDNNNNSILFSKKETVKQKVEANLNLGNKFKASTERPSFTATEQILKEGKLQSTVPSVKEIGDRAVTLLSDSTRPHDTWALDNLTDDEALPLIRAKNLAAGREAAFNKEVIIEFGDKISIAINKIVAYKKLKNNKITFEAAHRLAGEWLSATYAPIANKRLLNADLAVKINAVKKLNELKDALKKSESDLFTEQVRFETDRLKEQIKEASELVNNAIKKYEIRKKAIENEQVIDPTKQDLEAPLAGGLNNASAKYLTDIIEKSIPKKLLEGVAQEVYAMNEWKLQKDVEMGKVTQEVADKFDKSGKYVPLTGDPLFDDSGMNSFESTKPNISRDRFLKGKIRSLAVDGISASFEQIQKTAKYHAWNDYKDALHNTYETRFNYYKNQDKTDFEAQQAVFNDTGIKRDNNILTAPSNGNTIIYNKNGEFYSYDIGNIGAIEALRSTNVEDVPSAIRYLAQGTRIMSKLVTQLMFGFAPTNSFRDVWEKSENIRARKYKDVDMNKVASDMLKISLSQAKSIHKDISPVVSKGTWLSGKFKIDPKNENQKLLMQLANDGGLSTFGDFISTDGVDLSKKLAGLNTKISKSMDAIAVWNDSFEIVSSLSAYKALLQNGVPSKDAAEVVLELMNFRKGGTALKPIKALYMFAQPIATGGHQLIKTLSTPTGKKRFIGYMVAAMALYALLRAGQDDEELGINKMDELSNFQTERNIVIPTGDGTSINIPIGFGLPMLAWGYAVNLDKMILGRQTATETAAELTKLHIKTFAPVAPSETSISAQPMVWLGQTLTPSIFKPIGNILMDRTAFGAPLTSARFEKSDKANALEGKASTAELYKDIAKQMADFGFDMYPEQVKEIIKGYGLGLISEVLKASIDNPAKEANGKQVANFMFDRVIKIQDKKELTDKLYYRIREQLNAVGVKSSLNIQMDAKETKMLKLLNDAKEKEAEMRGKKSAATKEYNKNKNKMQFDLKVKEIEAESNTFRKSIITKNSFLQATK